MKFVCDFSLQTSADEDAGSVHLSGICGRKIDDDRRRSVVG